MTQPNVNKTTTSVDITGGDVNQSLQVASDTNVTLKQWLIDVQQGGSQAEKDVVADLILKKLATELALQRQELEAEIERLKNSQYKFDGMYVMALDEVLNFIKKR